MLKVKSNSVLNACNANRNEENENKNMISRNQICKGLFSSSNKRLNSEKANCRTPFVMPKKSNDKCASKGCESVNDDSSEGVQEYDSELGSVQCFSKRSISNSKQSQRRKMKTAAEIEVVDGDSSSLEESDGDVQLKSRKPRKCTKLNAGNVREKKSKKGK